MRVRLFDDGGSLAEAAATQAAVAMRHAIEQRDACRIILATGNSQLEFLEALTARTDVNWSRVEAFHLDEYVGLAMTHPASFRKFLLDRVIRKTGIVNYHFVRGDAADLTNAISNVSAELTSAPIDLAFIGIGENGHIAFNDPPANFETEEPYIVVELDEDCRRQQVGEGWFGDIAQVPTRAISMSPQQIMKAREIIAVVPELRKAKAVKLCLEGDVRPMAPASVLQWHANATIYLDRDSSSLLRPEFPGSRASIV